MVGITLKGSFVFGLAALVGAASALATPVRDYDGGTPTGLVPERICDGDRVFDAIKAQSLFQPPVDLEVRGIAQRVPYRPENNSQVGSWGETRRNSDGTMKFHAGVDLLADEGEHTLAIVEGKIVAVGTSTTLGKYVLLRGQAAVVPGFCSFDIVYAHLSEQSVRQGQTVSSGDVLGKVGRSGNLSSSIPTHLHLEVWVAPYQGGPGMRRLYTRDPMSLWKWSE